MTTLRCGCLVVAFLLSPAAAAADVEGYNIPERVQANGTELVLNGAGVRTQAAFQVYLAALYLPTRKDDSEAILRANQPSRVFLQFLRELTPEQISTSMNKTMKETLTPEQRAPIERRLKDFLAIVETLPVVKKGMQLVIDYVPQAGTSIRLNGESIGHIPGADFNQALLRTWIGERPGDTRLRDAMLGAR